jgi:hypothetical protein
MKFPTLPDATLMIGGWSSTCNNCGKSCNPRSTTHDVILGYDMSQNGNPGCGIEWTHVFSEYGHGETVQRMRPDLTLVTLPNARTGS